MKTLIFSTVLMAMIPSASFAAKITMACGECSMGFFSANCDGKEYNSELTIEDGTLTFAYRSRSTGVDPRSDGYFKLPLNECHYKEIYHTDPVAGGQKVPQTCFYDAGTMDNSASAVTLDTQMLHGKEGRMDWASFYRIRVGGDDGTGTAFTCRRTNVVDTAGTPANAKIVHDCAYRQSLHNFREYKNEVGDNTYRLDDIVVPSFADVDVRLCLNERTKNSVYLGQIILEAVREAEKKIFPPKNQ